MQIILTNYHSWMWSYGNIIIEYTYYIDMLFIFEDKSKNTIKRILILFV